jgi:hypothetical protein
MERVCAFYFSARSCAKPHTSAVVTPPHGSASPLAPVDDHRTCGPRMTVVTIGFRRCDHPRPPGFNNNNNNNNSNNNNNNNNNNNGRLLARAVVPLPLYCCLR